jgi:hypothetical protein
MILGAMMFALILASDLDRPQLSTVDGVTFHASPGRIYVSVRKISNVFGMPITYENRTFALMGRQIDVGQTRRLLNGSLLLNISELRKHGMTVNWDAKSKRATVKSAAIPGKAIYVRRGDQRVVVNKSRLVMAAWQGSNVVFRSQIGIGREGYNTPSGNYKVQPYRARMHRSSLYNNTPMPWSVQIVGNIFIHGAEVARGRTSHGCIRLPTCGANPAKWFYEWVERGTPISIQGAWPAGAKG